LLPLLSELIPPALLRLRASLSRRAGMYGNYATWQDAARDSDGYDSGVILERVRRALGEVRDGRAPFERDGCTFDRIHHSHPLLAALLYGAALRNSTLDVLDFGGSLGSSYFQCRPFLAPLARVRWNVVEQPAFSDVGRREFQTDQLRFPSDLEAALADEPRVLLLLSVLQFLPDPASVVKQLRTRAYDVIVVDRTPMWNHPTRITVQHVPAEIYGKAIRYPARIFSRDELVSLFAGYELASEFDTSDGPVWSGGQTGWHGGFIFTRSA
jgi:putative methyltransferase (TIGR04325 family)